MKTLERKKNIDAFVDALEDMIDAADDMWEYEQKNSFNQRDHIQKNFYLPAREKLRNALYNFIVEVIDEQEEESEK